MVYASEIRKAFCFCFADGLLLPFILRRIFALELVHLANVIEKLASGLPRPIFIPERQRVWMAFQVAFKRFALGIRTLVHYPVAACFR